MKIFKLVSSFNEDTVYVKAKSEKEAYDIFRASLTYLAEEYADNECEDEEYTREENIESFRIFRAEEYRCTEVDEVPKHVHECDVLTKEDFYE